MLQHDDLGVEKKNARPKPGISTVPALFVPLQAELAERRLPERVQVDACSLLHRRAAACTCDRQRLAGICSGDVRKPRFRRMPPRHGASG